MIDSLRTLATEGRYRLTLHSREEMENDLITTEALVSALASQETEIIEDYPEDPRGHSHLVLGWLAENEPVHICCAVHEDILVIVTVYRPNPSKWGSDWRTRK